MIDASHIMIGAFCIVVGMLIASFWQRRDKLTTGTVLHGIANVPNLVKLLYDDAVIVVQWLEQTTKPAQPGEEETVNSEKKARALAVLEERAEELLERELRPEEIAWIDRLVEAVVFTLKSLGVKLPQITLTGEKELLARLQQLQANLPGHSTLELKGSDDLGLDAHTGTDPLPPTFTGHVAP